jgi:hypothetical protein
MKCFSHLLIISIVCLGFVGCAADDTDDGRGTSLAPLTAAEQAALDQCLQDITECRLGIAEGGDPAKCREIAECLPDRPDRDRATLADLRKFCAGVSERCDSQEIDKAECDKLRERCERRDSDLPTGKDCMKKCLAHPETSQQVCEQRCGG